MNPPSPPTRLAIVTGTSAGIGQQVAQLLLDQGWQVIGLARRTATQSHPYYQHLSIDLRDPAALDAMATQQLEPLLRDPRWTGVGLVNNAAATSRLGPMERDTATSLAAIQALNTVAPQALMALVSRTVSRGVPLRIVNVSSGAATMPFPGLGVYCASKAALRMAGMVLAEEWKSDAPHAPTRKDAGILSYEPGVVDTAMQVSARSHDRAEFPWVAVFKSFQAKGMLVPPSLPARDIVAFLETARVAPFQESRLTP